MIKWEYNVFSMSVHSGPLGIGGLEPEKLGKQLDRLGEEGWELVSVVVMDRNGWANEIVATLKRPR